MSGLDILFDNPALGIIFGDDDITNETQTPNDPTTEPQPIPSIVDVKAEDMKVMTCNVQNTPNLPRGKVKRAGQNVSGRFHILGAQEMGDNGQDRSDFLSGLGSDYSMTHYGPVWVQEQIAWKTDRYTTGQGGWVQAIPGGQPYPNPPRGWTWQEFTTPGGIKFLFVDTHFVNKAWNTVPDSHKTLRQLNWKKHYDLLSTWLAPRVKATPVVVVGDFNRASFKPFTNNFRLLAGASSIDKIFIGLPQGWRVKAGPTYRITTPSDHAALGSQFTLDRSRAS